MQINRCHLSFGRGNILEDGSDATIIGCGLMVSSALEPAKELKKKGISCRVVDMFSIKPIDKDLIVRCAKETGAIATAEEHNVIGGLGGAVSEVIGETYPVPSSVLASTTYLASLPVMRKLICSWSTMV